MRTLLCATLSIVMALVASASSGTDAKELVDFELENQFGRVHRRSDVQGTIVLSNGSDKGGSQFNGAWSKAIHDSLGDHPRYDRISHLAYADLRGLPFFMRGFVRRKFPQDSDRWVLMDWKGILARTYELTPESSNVLVFASDGTLVHHESGREPDAESVRQLVAALRALLDEAR